MSPTRSNPLQPETLLEHAGWMRKLALSLVGDAHRADDLTQDTWVKALEHPPRTDLPLRGWLATVMRNALRQERRGESRRRDREAIASHVDDPPAGEGGAEVLARVHMQRELVEAVLTLEEPYRTTVLLRYFDELSPKRIADKQRVPVATVKTRLARGLDRLRQRLDANHGRDGTAWALALLPVLEMPAGSGPLAAFSSTSFGALVVNAKTLVLTLALLAIAATYFLTREDGRPAGGGAIAGSPASAQVLASEAPAEAELLGVADMASDEEPSPRAASTGGSARRGVAPSAEPPRPAAAPAPLGTLVRGRVVDLTGRPVADIEIAPFDTQTASETLGTSGDDGTFSVCVDSMQRLGVRDERFVNVMTGNSIDASAGKESIVVIAPRIRLAGQVIDELGTPIAGALVQLRPHETLRADLGWILDYSTMVEFNLKSDDSGFFEFADAPRFADGTLTAESDGFTDAIAPAPLVGLSDAVLVLARPANAADTLSGTVVDQDGFPVPGALVSLAVDTTTTDETGSFSFQLRNPDSFNSVISEFMELEVNVLSALKVGHLPAQLTAPGVDAEGSPLWPERVVLQLGGSPLSIAGRVVDSEGESLSGMRVWLADPTFFGGLPEEGRSWPNITQIETMLAEHTDSSWPYVETDSDGKFVLEGLLDRDYSIEVMDPETLIRVLRSGVPANTEGLEIELPFDDTWETLRGQVVDSRGDPVEAASVRLTCDAFQGRIQGQVVRTRHASGAATVTDEDGNFEFERVPKSNAYFRVDHADTIPIEVGRSERALRDLVGEDYDDFTLAVMRRCHFQIELASPDDADEFEIHDAVGTVLQVSEFNGQGRRDGYRFEIPGDRTNLLAVGDLAATLVLYREGEEVNRLPIELFPGEQPTLRP